MLTNKDIIKSLTDVGYTLQEISNWTQIDINILKKMKKNEQVEEEVETQLNKFFRMNIGEVDIQNFEDKNYRQNHLILTLDGFKKCKEYKNLGFQKCLKINFDNFDTILVNDSKIQLSNKKWIDINKIKIGDKLKVFDGEEQVISLETIDNIECCNIDIDGSCYIDGIILK